MNAKATLLPTAAILLVGLLATVTARAQLSDQHLVHWSGPGELTFTAMPGYTNYTVEWAPSVEGPWTNSWDHLVRIVPAGAQGTVRVPMFYRVVAHGTLVAAPSGMAYVHPGEFLMGDGFAASGDARPVRAVTVGAFFIDRREVTGTCWDSVYAWALDHGYQFGDAGHASAPNHPIVEIDWYSAVKWCNARSEMEGLDPVYFTDATQAAVYRSGEINLSNACVRWAGRGYRLPTEAEWEKAARGGQAGHHYPWTSPDASYAAQIHGDQANFWNSGDPYDNSTTPVGFYDGHQSVTGEDMANGYGLYDMAGNVAEICWDWHGPYPAGAAADPHGPDAGDLRIERGGSWYDGVFDLRCPTRRNCPPGLAGAQRGFRCVRAVQ